MIILDMINNLALLALFSMLSVFFGKRCPGTKRVAMLHGAFFGVACVLGMLRPVVMTSGVFYDGRSIMLSLCGLYFGPLATGVAACMALACRIAQGGAGAWAGSLVIVSAALLGLAFKVRQNRDPSEVSLGRLIALGLSVHVVMLAIQWLFLPAGMGLVTVKKIGVPVLLTYPLVTVLIGKILSGIMARDRFLEQLRRSEERFKMTLYSIGDGLIVTDAAACVTHLNPVAEQLTGWTEAEARGQPSGTVFHIINEDSRTPVESPVGRVLSQGLVVGLANHTLLIARDGSERPISDSGAPIHDAEGKVSGVVLVFRDQSLEREVQQELLRSEARTRRLIEHAPLGICNTTSDGYFVTLNDEMARILGYTTSSEVLQKNPDLGRLYVCPERRRQLVRQLESEGQVKLFEVELFRADQQRIWINLTARVMDRAADGSFVIEAFAVEITERKRTEQELVRNANRMSVLLRLLQTPVKSVQELLDYALEEVLSLTNSQIGYIYHYDKERKEFVLNTWSKQVMNSCQVVQPQTCYELDKTGLWGEAVRQRRPILVNDFEADNPFKKGCPEGHVRLKRFLTVPIFQNEDVVGVVGVANKEAAYDQEDVLQLQVLMSSVWKEVARKHAEEAQEKMEVQLHQAQKMEAVGRLAGGVAHDFNNILQAMLGYSELLLETLPETNHDRDLVKEVVSEGKRAAILTNQLLAFARKQTIVPKVLDLNGAISAMLKMLNRLLGEDIEVCWKPGCDLPPVKMDPGQIDQILANLTVNARDAITGVGKMTIETAKVYLDDGDCRAHVGITPGEYLMLAVSDDGCGIDKQTQERLFEPFFTTKQRGKGTGLGLATVYGIVRQNQGAISVFSEPGKGATFKIYLPAYLEEKTEEAQTTGTGLTACVGGKEVILIVDDEESLLRSGVLILKSLGYHVLSAKEPREAIRISEEYPSKIDLLLTDVVMPKLSGRDLQKKLQIQRPSMKSIFMSGYTANVIAHHGVLEEGINFLQKPFTRAALAAKIREALSQE